MFRKHLVKAIGLLLALCVQAHAGQMTLLGVGKPAGGGGATCASVLPGLVLNLDASNTASVIKTGANITAWNDVSGNGNNFSVSSATNPTYSATGFNTSKAGVTFSQAAGTFLESGSSVALNSANLSIFVVNAFTTSSDTNAGVVSLLGAGQANDFANDASLILAVNHFGNNYQLASNAAYQDAISAPPSTAQTVGWIFDGTNGTGYLNFSPDTPAPKTGTLGNPTATIALGARLLPTPGTAFLDGTIAEVIITSSALSGGQLTALHTCLSAKWGTP